MRWQMPSLVHRRVLNRQATDGLAAARMYALLAGLPAGVLTAVGLTGRPAMDDQVEQLLQRQVHPAAAHRGQRAGVAGVGMVHRGHAAAEG